MPISPHQKIINTIVREAFKPIGVKRKGQSRIWLDDNGLWTTVIEFQPSRWTKGTSLNIAVCFQWYPKEYYSFDVRFFREIKFVKFESEEQFKHQVQVLVDEAKPIILQIRNLFSDTKSLKEHVINELNENSSIWSKYNRGMACLISGDVDQAIQFFQQVTDDIEDREWAKEVKDIAQKLLKVLASEENYFPFIESLVNKSRELKKLKPYSISKI